MGEPDARSWAGNGPLTDRWYAGRFNRQSVTRGTVLSDQQAFLTQIAAAPDDDLPRLAYADWLDDHGEAERAEFIRLQIMLARDCRAPDVPAARRRLNDLLARHADEWEGDVRAALGGTCRSVSFSRGFPAEVTVDDLGPLLDSGLLARPPASITRLTVEFPPGAAGCARQVAALAACPDAGRLSVLDLSRNPIGDAGAVALAGSPHLGCLTHLHLQNAGVGDAGAAALADSPHLRGLELLSLRGNPVGYAGAVALAASEHLRPRARALALQTLRYEWLAREAGLEWTPGRAGPPD